MKKLTLALALIFPTIAAMAVEQPIFTQDKALTKLYDAELDHISLVLDGNCYDFEAINIINKHPVSGQICFDHIKFNQLKE